MLWGIKFVYAATHMTSKHAFDKAYYDRFYRNPKTRALTPAAARRHAGFIAAYLQYLEIPVRTILDVGCGTGILLRAIARKFPGARASGVEYSDYLCRKYGWTQGSVIDYQPEQPADLVICNDVLGYLDDRNCARALENIASMTRGAASVGVLTAEDLAICDESRTDSDQIARPVSFYRRRLARDFISAGGGLYLKQPVGVSVWHLERG